MSLQTIITTGRTQAEAASLALARAFGLRTGGLAARRLNWLRQYGLTRSSCHPTQLHPTLAAQGEATLWLRADETIGDAAVAGRAPILISANVHDPRAAAAAALGMAGARTLHIAGDKEVPALAAAAFLLELFHQLGLAPQLPHDIRDCVISLETGGTVRAFTPWPQLRCWTWVRSKACWMQERGIGAICRLLGVGYGRPHWTHPVQSAAAERIRASLPTELIDLLALFPSAQRELLATACDLGQPYLDLARDGAFTLMYQIADAYAGWNEIATPAMRALISRRRRDIAAALGLPPRQASVRLLAKIPPASCFSGMSHLLGNVLQDEHCSQIMRSLPRVNYGIMMLLGDPALRRLATPPLLREIAMHRPDDCAEPGAEGRIMDLLFRLVNEAQQRGAQALLEPLRSARAAQRLLGHVLRVPLPREHWQEVPASPLPGIAGEIEPLRDPADVVREGMEMHHCAGNYADAVAAGQLFLYRVLPFEPGIDRATVQIACHGDPANPGGPVEWRIEQLQGVCNKDVSVATVRLVEAWLAACACVQVYETNESEPTDDLFDDAAHDAELVPA